MDVIFRGGQTVVVPIEEQSQIGQARRAAIQAAAEAGFDDTDAGRAALVATELATNVLKHAKQGEIHIARVPGRGANGVEVIAVDRGPGFNLAECLPDGYSTGGTRGEGLGAVLRQTQVLDMHGDHRGAVVLARMYPKGATRADIRFGATQVRLQHELVCGDGWGMAVRGSGAACVVLIDGLGHGAAADEAAQAGVAAWQRAPFDEPSTMMGALNQAMAGTRGGAVAIARYEGGALRFAGVGNISASLLSLEGSRGLASHPGIVGVQVRRAQPFDFQEVGGRLLVMHSDGLQSRWALRDYPGLLNRHPAVITAVLHRDFSRGRDDATVFALQLEADA